MAAADGDAHACHLAADSGIVGAVVINLDLIVKRIVFNVVLVAGVYGLTLVEYSAIDGNCERGQFTYRCSGASTLRGRDLAIRVEIGFKGGFLCNNMRLSADVYLFNETKYDICVQP